MATNVVLDVDPRTLHLPNCRIDGADPIKLARQIAKFGNSIVGMPPILVTRDIDGELVILDGVTRATRVAKLLPGELVRVQVAATLGDRLPRLPTVGEKLS